MTYELSQTSILLLYAISIPCGAALCVIYDIFRLRRELFRSDKNSKSGSQVILPALFTGIEDILFFVIAGIVTSVLCFALFQGRFRIAVVFFEAAGFIIWRFTFGKLLMKVSKALLNALKKAVLAAARHILLPPAKAVRKYISKAVGPIKRRAAKRKAVKQKREKEKIRKLKLQNNPARRNTERRSENEEPERTAC